MLDWGQHFFEVLSLQITDMRQYEAITVIDSDNRTAIEKIWKEKKEYKKEVP